jgi:putative transport protein
MKFGYNYSLEILVMVVLGGMGNINGSILAATLITFLNTKLATILTGELAVLQNLLYALILIVIVIYNNAPALKSFREFGLMLFLVGAGVEGGVELVEQVAASEYGIMLVVYGFIAGALMTLIPMIVGYIFAKKICKLPLLNNLGSITGGMTSTPALGTLIGVAGTDDVAAAYAATYPIALVLVVLASQLINSFML